MAETPDIPQPKDADAPEAPAQAGFAYRYGDKPLEGYTVQRALGRGGFGEVYYALSDAGREVALKAIQGYEQIELRGVGQCMNLKSPHLVTIFDVRYNRQQKPFVLMEYVAGPSLRDLIDNEPEGIGTQKAAYFLQEIAKGLTFLHDCGIVHRDLKPGNIFWEDGYVKIGDYGLSKAIAASMHSQQTMTVGTVHYMAPEIGKGCYDRSIDIYALGAVAYEMLTGRPPYEGDSLGEVLMKHISSKPDMHKIPEPFRSAISKALEKDPAARFATVQEFVEAIFEPGHVRNSVSLFSPNELSMVAGRTARAIRSGKGPGGSSATTGIPQPPRGGGASARAHLQPDRPNMPPPVQRFGNSGGSTESASTPQAQPVIDVDSLSRWQRMLLAAVSITLFSVAGGTLSHRGLVGDGAFLPLIDAVGLAAMMLLGATGGIWLAWRFLRVSPEEKQVFRIAYGGLAALGLTALAYGTMPHSWLRGAQFEFGGTLAACAIALFVVDWQKVLAPRRKERVDLGQAFGGALVGMVLAFIFGGSAWLSIAILAGSVTAGQLLLPKYPRKPGTKPWTPARPHRPEPRAQDPSSPVSPYSRVVAMGMTFLIFAGLGGIQRLYVGKTVSGLLYLFTFGFFGVGQLLDLIAISAGRFTDHRGRALRSRGDQPVAMDSRVGGNHPDALGRLLGSLLVAGILLAGLALGLAVAVDLPAVIESGMFGADTVRALETLFGGPEWIGAMRSLLELGMLVAMLAGGLGLIVMRRRQGAGAMGRVIPGIGALILAAHAARSGLSQIRWQLVSQAAWTGKVGQAIGLATGDVQGPLILLTVILIVISVMFLAWSPRRSVSGREAA
ncbi:MAG: protein kinase domain-containing protein [Phycisphaerae bacterium]